MIAQTILAVLLLAQVVPEEDAPTLRIVIPRGNMAVYDIRYSDRIAETSPRRPGRIYIPASELEEPGLWSDRYRSEIKGPWETSMAQVFITGAISSCSTLGQATGDEDLFLGVGQHGVPAFFDPCLFGFNDRLLDTRYCRLSKAHFFPFQLHNPSFRRLPEEIWEISGSWTYPAASHLAGETTYAFDAPRKLFTRVVIREARVPEHRHSKSFFVKNPRGCSHPPNEPAVDIEFLYRATEAFPPENLGNRIDAARKAGARYLSLRAREVQNAIWFKVHPAGTRAVVAWAILRSCGELDAARRLIDDALREPLRTTYDAAFLVLALDALLSYREPLPEEPPSADGKTVVLRTAGRRRDAFASVSDRKRIEKALAAAASFLADAPQKESGLWGYNPGGAWCPKGGSCFHVTCWAGQAVRGASIDVSNTYWALDALRVAARRGHRAPQQVFDRAVRSLVSWGSYFKDVYLADSRAKVVDWKKLPDPKRAREILSEWDRRDRTLSLKRRLRLVGEDPGGVLAEPDAWDAEQEELRLFPYTSYIIRGKADPFPQDLAGYWSECTSSHTSQVAGVGALILGLRGLGQEPLRSKLVQEGLLLARICFRLTLASYDISWCDDALRSNAQQHTVDGTYPFPNLQPRDLGYNFLLLERVLDDLGVEEFGSHQWFPLLALHSLDLQREDGGWYPWRGDRLVPTALHLLFLSRSQEPDFSDPLPTYQPPPPATGAGTGPTSPWQALIAGPDGRHYRVAEVIASLKRVGKEERIRLASKGFEALPIEDRRALAPLLDEIASEGPAPAKAWAAKGLAEMKGPPPGNPGEPAKEAKQAAK